MFNKEMQLCAGVRDTAGRVPLKWVSQEGERIPQPRKTTYPLLTGFSAAGKYYPSLRQLLAEDLGDRLCRDIYGREILCLKELFPCFDSYDYLNENRYFRWFFLRHKGRLTMVYYADQRKTLEVTEDVDSIRHWQWEEMKRIWDLE